MELTDKITDAPDEFKAELEIDPKTLENYVFEALGYASMCWSETPKGEFDSTRAMKCGNELIRHINTDIPHACGVVFKALREQPDYYYAWQSNIAMAFKDNMQWAAGYTEDGDGGNRIYKVTPEQLHQIANDAAKHFLNLLIKPIEK